VPLSSFAAERVAEELSHKRGKKKIWHENEGLVKALEKNKVDIVDLLLKRREGTNNTAKYKMKKSGLYAVEDRFSLAAFLGFASSMAITKKKKGQSKDNKISFFDKFKNRATGPTPGSRFADIVMRIQDINKSLVFDRKTLNNLDGEPAINNIPPIRSDSLEKDGVFVMDSPTHNAPSSKTALLIQENFIADNNDQSTLKTTVSVKNLKQTLSPESNNNNTLDETKTRDETRIKDDTNAQENGLKALQIKVNRVNDEHDNKHTESTPMRSPGTKDVIEDLENSVNSDPRKSPNYISSSRNRLRPIINTKPINTGPIRPDIGSNKISLNVESSEMPNRKAFQIVGIAGIRSQFNPPKTEAKKVVFAEPEPEPQKEEEDDDFFEAVQKLEPLKTIKPESSLSSKFFKKINNVQPKNIVPVQRIGKSYQTIDMENDEINESYVDTMGVLDDSDFLDERVKHYKHEKTIKRRKSQVKTEFRVVKSGYETAADDGHLKMEEGDVGAKNEVLETEMGDDQEDDEFPLDLKLIQPDPIFNRQDYNSYSEDDVLPSLKENKKRLEEEEDMRRIREVTLLMEHVPTQTELKQAEARKNLLNMQLILNAAKTIAMKKSKRAQQYRKIEDEIKADKEAEEAAEELFITDRVNSKKMTRGFNAIPKNALNLPGVCENNGEFTSFDMMLKRIETKNEDEEDWLRQEFVDEQTVDIPKPEQWLTIRVLF
jgi:hypothetical protein